ncbi:MAG TPA: hypothetical protein VHP14_11285 [Anaerolineales bacterium]|nr:hypothetical protein [Anaerolineales bacterium]
MQPWTSFDRTRLIIIAVGVVLILEIAWIFLGSDPGKSQVAPTAMPANTSTLEMETLAPSPSAPPAQDETLPTATETSSEAYPELPVEIFPSTSTLITESLPPPSATSTPGQIQPFPAGKYDDTDPNIFYDRYWTALKNPGTKNAYQGTIHASNSIGNEASFRFIGEQFRLGYQRGRNFGTVTVIVDDQEYSFHEQAFDLLWQSPELPPGDHFVRIIHENGESINLDSIEILD